MLSVKENHTTHAKLGFTHLESAEIVENLNRLLANYHIHYQKLRAFHWNIEGAEFFELHEQFEIQYNTVSSNIDKVAERIRVFGKKPVFLLNTYLEMAEIKEVDQQLTARQMVEEIQKDFEILLSYMVDVTDAANSVGDAGTLDMITHFIKEIEDAHWKFSAYLKR